jgi:hypothetical protein
MGYNETWLQNEDGTLTLVSSVYFDDVIVNDAFEGEVQLVIGKATVQNLHAGKNVVLSRKQSTATAIGHLYVDIDEIVSGVSFVIKSTNASDAGIVVWKILE